MRNATITTILIGTTLAASGCGTLVGAGVGALAGQAIAGNTTGTLIGAGVGAASGFIVEEIDKDNKRKIAEAEERGRYDQWREMERRGMTTHRSETRRVLNPDGTVTETGTETVTSEQETSGYTGLPK